MFYFSTCAFNALAEIGLLAVGVQFNSRTSLRKFLNVFYTGLAFPAGAVKKTKQKMKNEFLLCSIVNFRIFKAVVTQFWIIYFFNREFIMVRNLDKIIPAWLNHVVHTLPLIACFMENFLTKHYYNKSFLHGSLPILVYTILYSIL